MDTPVKLEAALEITDNDIILRRNGKSIAAVIPYEDYLAVQDALDEARDLRQARAILKEWRQDPSTSKPWEQLKAELIAEGLLDG